MNRHRNERNSSYTPIQKDISIFTGASVSYHKNTNNYNIGPIFGFHGKLYLIPQYGQEGDIDRFFKEPILSEIGIEAGVVDEKVDNVHFLAKTVLAAGYALKAGQLTYDCHYSAMHGMPVTGGRGFRSLKPLWYNGVPP